jgi:hypothetical protein
MIVGSGILNENQRDPELKSAGPATLVVVKLRFDTLEGRIAVDHEPP